MTSVLEIVEKPAVEQPEIETPSLQIAAGQRLMLRTVQWSQYQQLGEALRDRSNLRLTYDRGDLEIVTTSDQHEQLKHRLNQFFVIVCEELELDFEVGGSMTFQRHDLERGLEPDECYWIRHAAAVTEMQGWDPEVHPPPDLVIEIEVSRTVVDRLGIYAALGVPELWRWTNGTIQLLVLNADRVYQEAHESLSFPGFPVTQIAQWVPKAAGQGYRKQLKTFRAWVKEQIHHG